MIEKLTETAFKTTKTKNVIKTTNENKSVLKAKYGANKNISEHHIQNTIIKNLVLRRFLVIRYNSGSMVDNRGNYFKFYTICNNGKSSGHPDLIFFKNKKCYFVEVKKNNGKLTSNQLEFQELCKRYNMIYIIARSWQELDTFLKENKV